MTYTGSPVTANRYMGMLTEKGLLYIINNNESPAEVNAAMQEIKRRDKEKDDARLQDVR